MALAVDVIDRRGPSNELNVSPIPAKEEQGSTVLSIYVYNSKRRFTRLLELTRQSALVL